MIRGLTSALATLLHALVATYRRGFALFLLAPAAVALVVVPEFAQHVVEIQGGMFDSRAAAHAFADDPLRWAFGYAKLTGLALAFLASARFWWTREHGGSWWRLGDIAWGKLLLGLLLFVAVPTPVALLEGRVDPLLYQVVMWTVSIATLPFALLLLAGLFGDRAMTVRTIVTRGWLWLPLLIVLLVVAFLPAQLLHGQLHTWSLGQPVALVWALMTFDSLLVGLLASLTGAALFTGYDAFAKAARPT